LYQLLGAADQLNMELVKALAEADTGGDLVVITMAG
jgi:hypothetical protein